jgi:TRAP transporter 4TM/12TM fusion protein
MSLLIEEQRDIPQSSPLARPLKKITAREWTMLFFGMLTLGFHVYIVLSGLVPNLITRPIHFMLALPWIFIFSKPKNRWERFSGYFFILAGFVSASYIVFAHERLANQFGSLQGTFQYVVSIVLILITIEMARRAMQAVLPAITLLVLIYGFFGHLISGQFGFDKIPTSYFLGTLTIAEGGIWSILTGINADTIAPIVLLGSFISAGAAGTGFMALATQIAGRFRAGTAKVAVLSSAMFGTISGIAAANTASTGMLTIPAMKRHGYPPAMAAATEAVASTGGQIMPPLMGAGIFIMAELLQIDYTQIMLAAILPAILFFIGCWLGVHQYAIKYNLLGMPKNELPGWILVARTSPFFFVPFGILIYFIAFTSYTVPYGIAFSLIGTVPILLIDSKGKLNFKRWIHRLWEATIRAAQQISIIAAIIICASLIVGVFSMTGLGVKITSIIVSVSGGNLWIALALTGLASLVLGMELPTGAAYLICVAVAGPALVELGLPDLYAHLLVFWYAMLCTITPPVCGNVFIAAGIAKTPWVPVAMHSMKIGLGLFVIPLAFISNPSLLLLTKKPVIALIAFVKVGIGLQFLSFSLISTSKSWYLRLTSIVLAFITLFFFSV